MPLPFCSTTVALPRLCHAPASIVLVDDQPGLVDLFEKILTPLGYEVLSDFHYSNGTPMDSTMSGQAEEKTILLVDDEPEIVALCMQALYNAGGGIVL